MKRMMGLKIETVKTEKGKDLKTGKEIDLTKVEVKMSGVIRCLYFPARISIWQNLLMNLTYPIVNAALPVTVCCQRLYAMFTFGFMFLETSMLLLTFVFIRFVSFNDAVSDTFS